jgi:hypothetical protein
LGESCCIEAYLLGALIVNRRLADHDQGDGLTFAEDWNEGLT